MSAPAKAAGPARLAFRHDGVMTPAAFFHGGPVNG
jgi:hypothetical protein